MVLSPDGEIVACGSQDNSVHFWRRSTSEDARCRDTQLSRAAYPLTILVFFWQPVAANELLFEFDGDGPEGTVPGAGTHSESITCLSFVPRECV